MSKCKCTKLDGNRCSRPVDNKSNQNHSYCWQHQQCIKPISESKEINLPKPIITIKTPVESKVTKIINLPKPIIKIRSPAESKTINLQKPIIEVKTPMESKTAQSNELQGDMRRAKDKLIEMTNLWENKYRYISIRETKELKKTHHPDGAEMHVIDLESTPLLEPYTEYLNELFNGDLLSKVQISKFLEIILKHLLKIKADLRRGDIVWIEAFNDYRNDGKFIFSGKVLEQLEFDIDEYGSVPSNYTVIDEFPIDYWIQVIDHNQIIWLNVDPYKDQLLLNAQTVDKGDGDEYGITYFKAIDGINYIVHSMQEYNDDKNNIGIGYSLDRFKKALIKLNSISYFDLNDAGGEENEIDYKHIITDHSAKVSNYILYMIRPISEYGQFNE